jgi:hypothetical protein
MRTLLFFVVAAAQCGAIEIATGKMLGAGYDGRSFYVRNTGESWRKTYTGPGFRPEAAGRLMNLRIGQAIVHDEWLTEERFDPEANTTRVIAALDAWKRNGVLAISTSLQGANPAYERTKTITRQRAYSLGPKKGMLMSAFRPDGSLKPEWMNRALRLARALDQRGMILHLIYFYQHQDEVLRDPAAIRAGAVNATDWLIANNLRNVIIEVANEVDAKTYDHGRYIHGNVGELIQLIRSRFTANKAGYRLPISCSNTGMGMMDLPPVVLEHGDLILLHGNHRTPEEKGRMTASLMANPKVAMPVVFSEDDNGRETEPATLEKELASLDLIYKAGGSWGYMPWIQAQIFPFRMFDPYQAKDRDAEYFIAVLDAIRSRVYAGSARR